ASTRGVPPGGPAAPRAEQPVPPRLGGAACAAGACGLAAGGARIPQPARGQQSGGARGEWWGGTGVDGGGLWRTVERSGVQRHSDGALCGCGERRGAPMFLGTHSPRLDDKGRLFLPAKYRNDLAGGVVITKGQERCLYVFPPAEFERITEALRAAP